MAGGGGWRRRPGWPDGWKRGERLLGGQHVLPGRWDTPGWMWTDGHTDGEWAGGQNSRAMSIWLHLPLSPQVARGLKQGSDLLKNMKLIRPQAEGSWPLSLPPSPYEFPGTIYCWLISKQRT